LISKCACPRAQAHVADGLSRRPRTGPGDIDEAHETDTDDFIDVELGALSIAPIQVEESATADDILEDGYSKDSQRIARYLTTLRKPDGINGTEFRAFKRRALRHAVMDEQLYLAGSKNIPRRRAAILVVVVAVYNAKIVIAAYDAKIVITCILGFSAGSCNRAEEEQLDVTDNDRKKVSVGIFRGI
jgi:hypothetical protein